MKRRAFIGLLGASALSMPFILGQNGPGTGSRNRISAAKKIPMRLRLPRDVTAVAAQLGASSRRVYLLGGTAAAAAMGVDSPYYSFLINTPKFPELKNSLFEFGVSPLSTPALPANFARFMHEDRAYNLLNLGFEQYTQSSAAGQENGLVLFAHNFLIYNIKDCFMLDPFDALKARTANGKAVLLKPIQSPNTLVHGFDHCLAATFDCALLGLRSSPEHRQLEERALNSTPSEEEAKQITSRILDYTSDVLEVGGMDAASRLLLSPVCIAAGKSAAQIDFAKIESGMRRLQKQGKEVSGREFMSLVQAEFKKNAAGKGPGLPEYLAMRGNDFRRIEVLMDAMESTVA